MSSAKLSATASAGIIPSERTTDAAARAEEAQRKNEAVVTKASHALATAQAAVKDARTELARLESEK